MSRDGTSSQVIVSSSFLPDGPNGVKITTRLTEQNFDLREMLLDEDRQFIEVAGPTDEGFSMVPKDIYPGQKNILVFNLYPGVPTWNSNGEIIAYNGKVDFQADSTNLPFREESVDGVFASCLERPTRDLTLQEAYRVLKPGGVVIWQGAFPSDIQSAIACGFEVIDFQENVYPHEKKPDDRTYINFILQKPSKV